MRHKWCICGKSGAFDICCDKLNHRTKFGPNRAIIIQVTAILSPLLLLASLGFEPMTLGLPQDVYCIQYYAPPCHWSHYFVILLTISTPCGGIWPKKAKSRGTRGNLTVSGTYAI